MKPVKCPYCGQPAQFTNGAALFPGRNDLRHKMFWRCIPCDAHVGCMIGSRKPAGTMANRELRQARQLCHQRFDRIWMEAGRTIGRNKARGLAYRKLSELFNLHGRNAHISQFSLRQCSKLLSLITQGAFDACGHDQNATEASGNQAEASGLAVALPDGTAAGQCGYEADDGDNVQDLHSPDSGNR